MIEERRLRSEDTPSGVAIESLFALVWKAHPYRRPVIGWRSDLERVTVEACQDFFDTYYAANNLTIVIVGDFETDRTLERIRRTFGKIEPAATLPRNPTTVIPQNGERRSTVYSTRRRRSSTRAGIRRRRDTRTEKPWIWRARFFREDGRVASTARSCMTRKRLSTRRAVTWNSSMRASSISSPRPRPDASLDEVESLAMAEIDRLAAEGVTDEELARAKRRMEVRLVSGNSTNHQQASRIGYEIVAFGKVRPLEARLEAIRAVTKEDVQRVVSEYLAPRGRNVVRVIAPPPSPPLRPRPRSKEKLDEASGFPSEASLSPDSSRAGRVRAAACAAHLRTRAVCGRPAGLRLFGGPFDLGSVPSRPGASRPRRHPSGRSSIPPPSTESCSRTGSRS